MISSLLSLNLGVLVNFIAFGEKQLSEKVPKQSTKTSEKVTRNLDKKWLKCQNISKTFLKTSWKATKVSKKDDQNIEKSLYFYTEKRSCIRVMRCLWDIQFNVI